MPDRRLLLKRAVSFNHQLAFATGPSNNGIADDEYGDEYKPKTLAIVMVGLPARGKTHIASCVSRYLNWLGFSCSIFNVESYRRRLTGGRQTAEFFDPSNAAGYAKRMEMAERCSDDMVAWLEEGGHVGIFDATNNTAARRARVLERLQRCGTRVLFLESVCNDKSILDRNLAETRLRSPDYAGTEEEVARADFARRISYYEKERESVDESEGAYIRIVDAGRQLHLHDIRGYLPAKLVQFLLNTNLSPRTIYLSRHGESQWNVTGQLGGDPNLSDRGRQYAMNLARFIDEEVHGQMSVWTSQLQRTRQTVAQMPRMSVCWRALNEIDAGVCEGLTYAQVAQKYPEVAEQRKRDKLRYRYPGGESYVDVIHRLEPVILELERATEPVLVVAHNAVIRAIYAYYTGESQDRCPFIEVPLHTIFKLSPRAYGVEVEKFELDKEALYRNKTPESNSDGP